MIFGRVSTLGIVLSNTGIQASFRKGGRGSNSFVNVAFVSAEAPLLNPFDLNLLARGFASLAQRLPKRARRLDVSVAMAIPDPLILEQVLDFKVFPEKEDEARALVEARVSREYPGLKARQVSAHQVVSRRDDHVAVLARSMSAQLKDALNDCLSEQGLNLCCLEGYCRFSPSQQTGTGEVEISVDVTADAWFLECALPERDIYFSQAGWIGDWRDDEKQITRLVRTFCLGNHVAPVIHINGSPHLGEALAGQLEVSGFHVSRNLSEFYFETLARRAAQWPL